jgi:ABC-type dipeptide/oligopeptide/nickel transport system permease component
MLSYIIKRLSMLPLVLFGVTLMVFGMTQVLDPYQRVLVYVNDPSKITREGLDQLIDRYGLDDPAYVQYFRWLNNVVHGNLGWSQTVNMPVSEAMLRRAPATIELALFAFVPIIFLGIWFGVFSAVHHNDPIDHATRIMAITGWSFPTFVVGILLLMVFYGALDWFQPGRLSLESETIVYSTCFHRYTGLNTLDAVLNGSFMVLLDSLRHLFLPVMTLAYVEWALILRVMRSSMLETLRQDYVTTARAKGLKERVVIKKHARRNALMPVVTLGNVMILWLLSGDVVVETIFNFKGIGQWAAAAALQLDIPSVLGFALFAGVIMVVGNLVVDIMYVYLNPTLKLGD